MNTYKTWVLAIPKLEEHDAVWLKGLDVGVKVEALTNKVYSSGQVVSKVVTGHQIEVLTSCEKQENMLKLKYGNDLILKVVINSVTVPYEDFYMVSHR